MATVQHLPAAMGSLVRKLGGLLGDARAAQRALALVRTHAADEQLALATVLRLAEESADAMRAVLGDRALARDLIFCVGASEIVASEMSQAGPGWLLTF